MQLKVLDESRWAQDDWQLEARVGDLVDSPDGGDDQKSRA